MPISQEYRQYLASEVKKEKPGFYEKMTNALGTKMPFNLPINQEDYKKMSDALEFVGYKTKPEYVYKTGLMIVILSLLAAAGTYFLASSLLFAGMVVVSGLALGYYAIVYVSHAVRYTRIKATSDLLLAVLYMVISLRLTPNLENALVFAAVNIGGVVGKDLKKISWDLSLGKYDNADEAIEAFSRKWRHENDEFSEAIDVIRTSAFRGEAERNKMYEEAINIILERNTDRMKSYTQNLTNPVAIINYLGITLPVLTIILFPILTIFLSTAIKPSLLVIVYDVVLPIVVYWLMMDTLRSRPLSFGEVDISSHPDAHKIGTFKFGKKTLPILPFSITLGAILILLGSYLIFSIPDTPENKVSFQKIAGGLTIVWGIASAFILYSYLSYRKNIAIRETIVQTEDEFTTSLYELGLILQGGYSVETSVEKLVRKIRNLKISFLFQKALDNIKGFGYTFEKSIFDPNVGVIRYYPSSMIRNILRIFVESLGRGSRTTAVAMMSVSGYLKSVKRVEQFLKEMLSETTAEMQFMMSLLVPVACGIIVGLAALMTLVVVQIGQMFNRLTGLASNIPFDQPSLLSVIGDPSRIVPIEWFAIIVGVYMIEVILTLAIFVSSLRNGEDSLEKHRAIANGLILGMVVFTIVSVLVFVLMRGFVQFA